jgi:hypothetical protein
MAATTCPRCGFVQEGGSECARCGVVFGRAHAPGAPHPRPAAQAVAERPQRATSPAAVAGQRHVPSPVSDEPLRRGWFGRTYRILRWVTLAVLVAALLLILRTSAPPEVQVDAGASARVTLV